MAATPTALRLLALLSALLPRCESFNLDVDKPSVFSGPDGSYFGFSVDFFKTLDNQRSDVLIGAPRANSSSPAVWWREGRCTAAPDELFVLPAAAV
ncbi:integrin alpha-V-like [Anabas testudineus]|uniref:integrin alpha-V-like n=1 Tax=Anabas testudineus TaxID=64144 RepID=UPI000E4614E2|nr:integrin alpha-V-like [Anabas testudineus]